VAFPLGMKKLESHSMSRGDTQQAGQASKPAQVAISPQMHGRLHPLHPSATFLSGQ